jgi:hypothetical protein
VQEAMACNLPIATVDVGDVRERLHGVEASLIAPRNAPALGKQIINLVAPLRRSNGRDFIADLSLSAIAPKIVDIYRSLLHGQNLPSRGVDQTATMLKTESRAAKTISVSLISIRLVEGVQLNEP